MKNAVKLFFKDRTIGFWLSFGAAVIALLSSIVYLIIYLATPVNGEPDRVYSLLNFILFLVGALTAIGSEYFGYRFGVLIPSVLYAIGVGNHFMLSSYPMADHFVGVAFFGGDYNRAMVFGVLFLLVAIANIISAFMPHRHEDSIEIVATK